MTEPATDSNWKSDPFKGWDIEEIRAGEKAVDALPWGNQNPKAAEVEAEAIADFRAKRDAQRAAEAAENKEG